MFNDSKNFETEPLLTFNNAPDTWFNQTSCMRKTFYDKFHPMFTYAKRGDIVFWWNVLSLGGKLKTFPMNVLYKRHTDHTSYYSDTYNITENENQFQADIAKYKQLAFEKVYEETHNDKYLECVQIFKNTSEYFSNLK